jgi:hypothetical protein
MTQQVQPAFIMALQQSQDDWIMAQQEASPLVQVTQTPLASISHLHMAIVMLQQQAIIPFIMQQQEHIPPAIMVQRFWIMVADTASSLVQVIFIPPVHFSILIVHRGTIIMFGPAGMVEGDPITPVPAVPMLMPIMLARSIIIAVLIFGSPAVVGRSIPLAIRGSATQSRFSQSPGQLQELSSKICNLLHDFVDHHANQTKDSKECNRLVGFGGVSWSLLSGVGSCREKNPIAQPPVSR